MALQHGTKLGPYEILAPLGAGGMGEVYRARDTRLGRDVALKVLPEALAKDSGRMARFEREAQILASLNHPNIAAIYGLEESGGVRALVTELVEGPTLEDKIRAAHGTGALQLDEALPIAKQIAEALEAAHERGIIHRDLKPSNVKVTPEGTVKVLDFGLAKGLDAAASGVGAVREPALQDSPTLSAMATQAGMILGTAAYMSPEQARGKAVDRRADIWAFGCVLYEMLTGSQAFEGETVSDVLAGVIRAEPNWSSLPAETPAALGRLIRRCLEKDPKRRLQAIGEARIAIEETITGGTDAAADLRVRPAEGAHMGAPLRPWRRALPWVGWGVAAALLVSLLILTVAYFRATSATLRPVRSYVLPPEKTSFQFTAATGGAVLSPDGTRLVFPAREASGKDLLWVRPLDSLSAQRLEGTEGASFPFWSPNSRFLGFFVPGKLKKIDVSGGPPQTICDASSGRGGAWNANDIIVFAPEPLSPLSRVPAAGGAPTPFIPLDKTRQQTTLRWPVFLPAGRHLLYWGGNPFSTAQTNGIYLGSLEGKGPKFLFQAESEALYAPPGYLLYLRERSLMAQPFDAGSLKTTGDAFPIAEQVANPENYRLGFFSVSQNGVLVYLTGAASQNRLLWLDASGKQVASIGEPGFYLRLRLSPDGSRLAEEISEPQRNNLDIWLVDLARGVPTRFTFHAAPDIFPVWSPDGGRIAFASNRKGHMDLYVKNASGAGTEEPLFESEAAKFPTDWSRDGRFIAFNYSDPNGKTNFDIWVLPLSGDRKPFPFLQTEFNEAAAVFSPDGRWLAYQSDESGNFEIYVAPFEAPGSAGVQGGKWQVSHGGGRIPTWRRDGKGLYYLSPEGKIMEAAVTPKGSAVEVGIPHEVLHTRFAALGTYARIYDVSPDGKRFLVNSTEEAAAAPLTLVTNWSAGLKKQ